MTGEERGRHPQSPKPEIKSFLLAFDLFQVYNKHITIQGLNSHYYNMNGAKSTSVTS